MSEDEHDREAGRQLAWLLVVVTVLVTAGVIYWARFEPEPMPAWAMAAPLVLVALTIAAFVKPVLVIRAVSGRFTELLDGWAAGSGPRAQAIAADVRPVLAAQQEGQSLEALAVERVVKTVAGRRRVGKLLMLGGVVGTGVLVPLWGRIPENLVVLPAGLFVAGLVIWYRTL
jgi:hypothetical protein